jgi:hypothetical protein
MIATTLRMILDHVWGAADLTYDRCGRGHASLRTVEVDRAAWPHKPTWWWDARVVSVAMDELLNAIDRASANLATLEAVLFGNRAQPRFQLSRRSESLPGVTTCS